MPERSHRKRETIAWLRARASEMGTLADELESELPPAANRSEDEGAQRRAAALERARRLGITVIKGTGIAAVVAGLVKLARENTTAAALLLAGTAATGGAILAPAIAPAFPGLPVIGSEPSPTPTVTRTVPASPLPVPTTTVTASPSPSPSVTPSGPPSPPPSPSPTASAAPPGTPPPAAGDGDGGVTAGGGDDPPGEPPAGDGDDGNAPPVEPPAEPPPVGAPPARSCVLGVDLAPLLGLCVLGQS